MIKEEVSNALLIGLLIGALFASGVFFFTPNTEEYVAPRIHFGGDGYAVFSNMKLSTLLDRFSGDGKTVTLLEPVFIYDMVRFDGVDSLIAYLDGLGVKYRVEYGVE